MVRDAKTPRPLKYLDFEIIEDGIVDSCFRGCGHDYGIDALFLLGGKDILNSKEELDDFNEDSKFVFHIIQFKKGTGIDQQTLLKLREGIDECIIKDNCDYDKNELMATKLAYQKEVLNHLYEKFPAENIKIKISVVFGGRKSNVTENDLLMNQLKKILEQLRESGYSNNEIEIVDANRLLELEKIGDEIVDIIRYSKSFKYMPEIEGNKKITGYVSILDGEEVSRLVEQWDTALFEANIRDFYKRNDLNSKILDTCSSNSEARYF